MSLFLCFLLLTDLNILKLVVFEMRFLASYTGVPQFFFVIENKTTSFISAAAVIWPCDG